MQFMRYALASLVLACLFCGPALAEGGNSTADDSFGARFTRFWDGVQNATGPLRVWGDAIGFAQVNNRMRVGGQTYPARGTIGTRINLRAQWTPVEGNEFYIHLHYGQGGRKATPSTLGLTTTVLNELLDDYTQGGQLRILEALYTHRFASHEAFITVGQTDSESFIDGNAFANDYSTQFLSTSFCNDPVLDAEDDYVPSIAAGFNPTKRFNIKGFAQASTRPTTNHTKGQYDHILDSPHFGAQAKYSPTIGGLAGNYRLFAWTATYQHQDVTGTGSDIGWGLGFNFDQYVTETIGVFARIGYHNPLVYQTPLTWSVGASFTGLIPKRASDVLGLGIAGAHGNWDSPNKDVEYTFEGYYNIQVVKWVQLSPVLQYVANPLANDANQGIFQGILRLNLMFDTNG